MSFSAVRYQENPRRGSDWRVLERSLSEQGWRIAPTSKGHIKLFAPDGKCIVLAGGTPSDHRAFDKLKSDLRRCGYRDETREGSRVFAENPIGTGGAILVGSALGLVAYLLFKPSSASAAGRAPGGSGGAGGGAAGGGAAGKTLAGLYVQTFCIDNVTSEESAGAPLRLADLSVDGISTTDAEALASAAAQAAFDAYVSSPLALTESFRVFATDLPLGDENAQLLALRETRPLFCHRPGAYVMEIQTMGADGTISRNAIVSGVGEYTDEDVKYLFDNLPKTAPTAVYVRDRANAQRLLSVRSTNGFLGNVVPTAGSGVVVPITF